MKHLIVSVALFAIVAGCGDSDPKSSGDSANSPKPDSTATVAASEESTLSKREFVSRATRICRRSARRAKAIAREELAKPEVRRMTDVEKRFHIFFANERNAISSMEEIEQLEAPAEIQPDVDQMTEDVKESLRTLRKVSTASEDEGSELVTQLNELAASSRRAAQNAGLTACLPEQTR